MSNLYSDGNLGDGDLGGCDGNRGGMKGRSVMEVASRSGGDDSGENKDLENIIYDWNYILFNFDNC